MQRTDPANAQRIVDILTANSKDANAAETSASPGQPGPIVQITDADSWKKACLASGSLCVVAFFNGQDEKNEQMFKDVAALEASAPLRFSYVDGSCYTQFANAFDIQEYKLPTVAVYSAKKER